MEWPVCLSVAITADVWTSSSLSSKQEMIGCAKVKLFQCRCCNIYEEPKLCGFQSGWKQNYTECTGASTDIQTLVDFLCEKRIYIYII